METSVPEVVNVFKEIQEQPQKIFEMIRFEVREVMGALLDGDDGGRTDSLSEESSLRAQGRGIQPPKWVLRPAVHSDGYGPGFGQSPSGLQR